MKKFILSVEDDPKNVDLFSDALTDWNAENVGSGKEFEPLLAGNYAEAVAHLDKYQIDCALLDLRLPENDKEQEKAATGNRLAEEILYSRGIPLAIISGHTGELDAALFSLKFINIFEKGDGDAYSKALGWFGDAWNMMEVLKGAKKRIDTSTAEIFAKRLWPQWQSFSKLENVDEEMLTKIISRQYVSHVADLASADITEAVGWHPYENFVIPSLYDNRAHTGDIFAISDENWIVLSPQCDMANQKISNVLLAKCLKSAEEWEAKLETLKKSTQESQKDKLGKYFDKYLNQNLSQSEHFLPPIPGEKAPLIVSFSTIQTIPLTELNKILDKRRGSVSSPFLPNLIQRFGAFISRTGQPNLDIAHFS